MMESSFDVIFKLADGPIKHIENLIKKLAVKTGVKLGGHSKIAFSSQAESMDFESKTKKRRKIFKIVRFSFLDATPNEFSQHNGNSALMLVRFLNCLGKAAVGIVYYVDCTVKDELLRRKEAKQTNASNKKLEKQTKKTTKRRTKRKTPDEDEENPSDTTTTSNLTVRRNAVLFLNLKFSFLVKFNEQSNR